MLLDSPPQRLPATSACFALDFAQVGRSTSFSRSPANRLLAVTDRHPRARSGPLTRTCQFGTFSLLGSMLLRKASVSSSQRDRSAEVGLFQAFQKLSRASSSRVCAGWKWDVGLTAVE